MRSIGIRELKDHISEVLRQVRENGEEVEVTYHGRPVARLAPLRPALAGDRQMDRLWCELDQLAAEIGQRWPGGVTAAEAVSEGRREL